MIDWGLWRLWRLISGLRQHAKPKGLGIGLGIVARKMAASGNWFVRRPAGLSPYTTLAHAACLPVSPCEYKLILISP